MSTSFECGVCRDEFLLPSDLVKHQAREHEDEWRSEMSADGYEAEEIEEMRRELLSRESSSTQAPDFTGQGIA